MRIAVIGSGIAGLSSAWLLAPNHRVTLFEAHPRVGGHSHTVDAVVADRRIPVDTGFIVYNERNYPNLTGLFSTLDVPTAPSNMSFGFSQDGGAFEYASMTWPALFAQRRRWLDPRHYALLAGIVRFNRRASAFLASGAPDVPLGDWFRANGVPMAVANRYVLPMAAAIWSAPITTVQSFSARSFLTFFDRHGLLTVADQPQWRTVVGGSRVYVERMLQTMQVDLRRATPIHQVRRVEGGVVVTDAMGNEEPFDAVVLAAHADETRAMIADKTAHEDTVLGRFPYQPNHAILHSDPALMPKRRRAWASWNFLTGKSTDPDMPVSITYWMNSLQNIDPAYPLFVSLNPLDEPDPDLVHARMDYAHPVFDTATIEAQAQLAAIQGAGGLWYAGAWCGYGFHEDGLNSAIAVARQGFGIEPPWLRPAVPTAAPASGAGGLVAQAAARPA
ncbi:MAG: FAD-dependent oxidoreductase [Geminicoccaceae bacterium]|nr:MAG: FAD-dependent oxidoreductase [Geminicoccaceae bacterium]